MSDLTKSASTEEFEQIYRSHAGFVYSTAYGILGNREDARDVLQNVFLKFFRRKPSLRPDANVKGYLYRAAVNRSLDVLEARRRSPQQVDAEDFPEALWVPEDPCFKLEMHDRLYRAIGTLDRKTAEILTLRYVHDLSDAEIAKTLGMSRTVVAVRLFRARARLKKLIRTSLGEKV